MMDVGVLNFAFGRLNMLYLKVRLPCMLGNVHSVIKLKYAHVHVMMHHGSVIWKAASALEHRVRDMIRAQGSA